MDYEIVKLGDIFNIKSSKRVHKKDWRACGVPFYRAREVVKLARNGSVNNDLFITPELYDKFTKESGAPKNGDLIISAVGTLGQCYLVKTYDKFYFKDASVLWLEKLIDSVDSKFVEYAFKSDSVLRQIMSQSGATVGTLTIERTRNIEIPLPPLPEQKSIVALLDEAFAKLDRAKEIAEKNLRNAKELFESYLNQIFGKPGAGWEERRLGEVCDVIGGGTPSKANAKFYGGDILWATVRDMRADVIKSTEHTITLEAVKSSSTNIIPKGNVVIATRVGLGKVCFLEQDTAINQDLRGVVPLKGAKLLVKYLFWWFKSQAKFIIENGTGATVHGVKLPFIKGLLIPLPSIEEQEVVASRLEELSGKVKELSVIYGEKIDSLGRLKRSLLEKAFKGC